jgi:hypothetical protein
MEPDSSEALVRRRDAANLAWRGPALMPLARDALLGLALVPVNLAFIPGRISVAGWLPYGTLPPPHLSGPLPWPAAVCGVLVWPFPWGLTEQMTHNGYLVPRFQVLCPNTRPAIVIVAFAGSNHRSGSQASAPFTPTSTKIQWLGSRLGPA